MMRAKFLIIIEHSWVQVGWEPKKKFLLWVCILCRLPFVQNIKFGCSEMKNRKHNQMMELVACTTVKFNVGQFFQFLTPPEHMHWKILTTLKIYVQSIGGVSKLLPVASAWRPTTCPMRMNCRSRWHKAPNQVKGENFPVTKFRCPSPVRIIPQLASASSPLLHTTTSIQSKAWNSRSTISSARTLALAWNRCRNRR